MKHHNETSKKYDNGKTNKSFEYIGETTKI